MSVVCLRNSERRPMYLECQVLLRYRNQFKLAAEESPARTDHRVLLQDGLGRNEAVCEEHVREQQANGLDSGKGQTQMSYNQALPCTPDTWLRVQRINFIRASVR